MAEVTPYRIYLIDLRVEKHLVKLQKVYMVRFGWYSIKVRGFFPKSRGECVVHL